MSCRMRAVKTSQAHSSGVSCLNRKNPMNAHPLLNIGITGVGQYLPLQKVTSQELSQRWGIPSSKTHTNVEEVGNTSDASIALVVCDAMGKNLIRRNDLVLISALGPGCIFEVVLIKWY